MLAPDSSASPAVSAEKPHIGKITLTNFRNYASLSIDLDPGAVVLTGENGAGKTNFIEAVSFLSPGRGLRRAAYADIARAGANGFVVHATLVGAAGETEIGTGTIGGDAGPETQRKVRINGATPRSADQLLEWLRVVWLTPAMDGLFTGPAGDRRRFLDRMVLAVEHNHGRRVTDYEKAMRGRNRLLAEGSRNDAWLDAIEREMAESGVAIAAARAETMRLLSAIIASTATEGPFPRAGITLAGPLESAVMDVAAVDLEETFRRTLAGSRHRDRAAGRTLDGPHRTDLVVRHEFKDMPAELCSTGEQKALLVGIVLAHARLCAGISGTSPVILLDEIAAHLDAGRRAALFDILEEIGAQVFMTGTEPALFASLAGRAQFLTVDGGRIRPTAERDLPVEIG